MLNEMDATAMLAVKDVTTARSFYEGTLGFVADAADQNGMVNYRSGQTPIMVYESAYAGTNQANALAWSVGADFDTILQGAHHQGRHVRALRPAGPHAGRRRPRRRRLQGRLVQGSGRQHPAHQRPLTTATRRQGQWQDAGMKLRDVGPDDLALWERLRCDPVMNTELGGPQPREEIPGQARGGCRRGEHRHLVDRRGRIRRRRGHGLGVHMESRRRRAVQRVGWGVLPEFQGQGVGKHSVAALLERARADGRWGTIHAFPAITNAPSNGICRSLGFTLIGQEAFEFRGTTLHCNHWQIDPAGISSRFP